MIKSNFYIKTAKGVRCLLCPHECDLQEQQVGICMNRKNSGGEIVSLVYGKPCALNIDPIEKKPLFHFLPASTALSIGTLGCNMRCKNCQNYNISQKSPDKVDSFDLTPHQIIEKAKKYNSKIIAYTYNEPITFYEYMCDIAVLAHKAGIKNVMISNGYINEKPLNDLLPFIDGANIDLKCFDEEIYKKLTGARLSPVLKTLEILCDSDVWLEITNLVIPDWTDDFAMINKMCLWLVDNGFAEVPIHFSRFFPVNKLKNQSYTAEIILMKARDIALSAGIKYVYIGNISHRTIENTYCPKCNQLLIERVGFQVKQNNIIEGVCDFCGEKISGVWKI
ncbi:MAG: AmmeMemoRadiSam system radical SAM enzyme [Bacteroidota bacterium]|nr:AmmeMemoRadiSam system radical SAM enzyme [Bacteroidota bacterium]